MMLVTKNLIAAVKLPEIFDPYISDRTKNYYECELAANAPTEAVKALSDWRDYMEKYYKHDRISFSAF